MSELKLESSWKLKLQAEFEKPYMKELKAFLANENQLGKLIYPKGSDIFNAFKFTPFDKVKVVILGQDPYHNVGQAHGLAFSVLPGVDIPPSLVNIFKELKDDLGHLPPQNGNLEAWAREGVLLLNNVLTVEAHQAHSHQKKGWEQFTSKVIEILNDKKENLVFILWGKPAQDKAKNVDEKKHFIIKAPHPSPLSSYRGFFGSKPFSKTNTYLKSKNRSPINWNLS